MTTKGRTPKRTPYEALDVDRKATTDTIKRNYRRKAKEFHPDKGGDAQEFAEVAKAYKLLTDSQRRKHYGETGDEGETEGVQQSAAVSILAGFFQQAVIQAINDNSFREHDIIAIMRTKAKERQQSAKQNAKTAEKAAERMTKLKAKVVNKGSGDLLERMFDEPIREFGIQVASMNAEAEACGQAVELLADYEFKSDKPQDKWTDTRATVWKKDIDFMTFAKDFWEERSAP